MIQLHPPISPFRSVSVQRSATGEYLVTLQPRDGEQGEIVGLYPSIEVARAVAENEAATRDLPLTIFSAARRGVK